MRVICSDSCSLVSCCCCHHLHRAVDRPEYQGDVTNTLVPVVDAGQRADSQGAEARPSHLRALRGVGRGVAKGDLGCYYGTSGYTTAKQCPDKVTDRCPTRVRSRCADCCTHSALAAHAIPLERRHRYRAGSLFDKGVNTVAFGISGDPNSCWPSCSVLVGVKLGWTDPTSANYESPIDDLNQHFRAMALPTISLAAGQSPCTCGSCAAT